MDREGIPPGFEIHSTNNIFHRITLEEKLKIKQLGRSNPDLNITQKSVNGKNCIHIKDKLIRKFMIIQ